MGNGNNIGKKVIKYGVLLYSIGFIDISVLFIANQKSLIIKEK